MKNVSELLDVIAGLGDIDAVLVVAPSVSSGNAFWEAMIQDAEESVGAEALLDFNGEKFLTARGSDAADALAKLDAVCAAALKGIVS